MHSGDGVDAGDVGHGRVADIELCLAHVDDRWYSAAHVVLRAPLP
jgi:hypothetical protein